VRIRIRGVNTVRKRLADGSVGIYYYHRASGLRLQGQPNSPEFLVSFAEAERSLAQRNRGTLAGLIRAFDASTELARKAESTRKEYRRMFRVIEDAFGDAPLAAVEDPRFTGDLLDWHDKIAARTPREADNRLAVLSLVLAWAKRRQKIKTNPLADGFDRAHRSDRSEIVWEEEDIERFISVASPELTMALMIALYTGLRQGDLLRLPWSAYDGRFIVTAVAKSSRTGSASRRVEIPVHSDLKAMLDAFPRRSTLILTNTRGQPWTQDGFQTSEGKARRSGGLRRLHFHDLRGTAITRLSEAGATPQEIATITGHSLRTVHEILDKYLARRRPLAEAAILKLENATRTTFANRLQTSRRTPA
jgi:integrase